MLSMEKQVGAVDNNFEVIDHRRKSFESVRKDFCDLLDDKLQVSLEVGSPWTR
jgi:hypothetical protein